jgi:hypothetical protein
MRTLQQRRRSLLLPIPVPFGLTEECRRAGLDEQELTSARASMIVVVHIDADGKHRIEADVINRVIWPKA